MSLKIFPLRRRRREDDGWRLFFCHIPKTGGTSLRRALEALIAPSQTIPADAELKRNNGQYPPLEVALEMAGRHLGSMRLFRGHYHFSCRRLLPPGFRTTVVLRDPLERNISLFRHMISRHGKSHEHLTELLHSGRPIGNDNHMTRYLAGAIALENDGRVSDGHLFGHVIRDPDRALEEAKAALLSCDFVGLTSNLSSLAERLGEFTGSRLDVGAHNESTGTPPRFTPQEIDLFLRHNELDQRLYEFASKLN